MTEGVRLAWNPASKGVRSVDPEILIVDADSPYMTAAFALRSEVFVDEQAVSPELEFDGLDDGAIHLVALCKDEVAGTLRMLDGGGCVKIGRLAVRKSLRGGGIGKRLMQAAMAHAAAGGHRKVLLHAQLEVKEFYTGLGFQSEGGVFHEAGIPHVVMWKRLPCD